MRKEKLKVITLGGGTGGYVIDKGLVKNEDIELISIFTTFDNGGSTGRLRDEFGILPVGDMRRRIVAHSTDDNHQILRELFFYRFQSNGDLNDHSLGNIILSSVINMWGVDKGISNIIKLFNIKGKILPITNEKAELCAILSDNSILIGESKIDLRDKDDTRIIKKIFLSNKVSLNKKSEKAIIEADYIIICPGDLYTSILPILLVDDFKNIIKKSKAKIIYIANYMTKHAETKDYKLDDFVKIIEKYTNKNIDYILYSNNKVSKEIINKYKKIDKAHIVDISKDFKDKNINKIIYQDFINKEALNNGLIRHDSDKVANCINKIINKKLFIWDLDDTIINTSHAISNNKLDWNKIKIYNNINKRIEEDKINKHILLSHCKPNIKWQKDKVKKLKLSKTFDEYFYLNINKNKKDLMNKIIKKYKGYKAICVGDREDNELEAAHLLNISIIKVSFNGKYHNVKSKYKLKPLLEIKKEKDFDKIFGI